MKVRTTLKMEVGQDFVQAASDIFDAISEGVDDTVTFGVKVAKRHAPVRKVTKYGGRATVRDLTSAEIRELPGSVRQGITRAGYFRGTKQRPQVTVRRSLAGSQNPSFRINGRIKRSPEGFREISIDKQGKAHAVNPLFGGMLDARGRYEKLHGLRRRSIYSPDLESLEMAATRDRRGASGRAVSVPHATLGGRLRGEIYGEMRGGGGGIVEGAVVSPTEYARYVEFPTSRTAAQPYMRPARSAMEKHLPKAITRSMKRRLGAVEI
jgi:hypothetical protein